MSIEFFKNENISYTHIYYFIHSSTSKKTPIFEKNNISKEELNKRNERDGFITMKYGKTDNYFTHNLNTKPTTAWVNGSKHILNSEELKSIQLTYSIYLKYSPELYVIDVDDYSINHMDDLIELLKAKGKHYKSFINVLKNAVWIKGNNKGIHIYIKIIDMPEYTNQINIFKDFAGDLLRKTNVWERPNKTIENYNKKSGITSVHYNDISFIFGELNTKEKKRNTIRKQNENAKKPDVNQNIKKDGKPIKEVKKLLELLDVKRADTYYTWWETGVILYNSLNDSEEAFKLWNKWSKNCVEKYNQTECRNKWNDIIKSNYQGLGFGKLKMLARKDNPDLINFEIEKEKFETIDFNQKYITESDVMQTELKKWNEEDDNKLLCLKSAYGTGKTWMLKDIIKNNDEKYGTILFITHRQTLTYNIEGNFKDFDFVSYMDGDFEEDRLICQIESIHKIGSYNMFNNEVFIPTYDLIILDEVESLLNQFSSTTLHEKFKTFQYFDTLIKNAKKVIALDGDFDNRSYDYLKTIVEKDFKVLNNKYIPDKKQYFLTQNEDKFKEAIMQDYRAKKKIAIVSMSSEYASRYGQMIYENITGKKPKNDKECEELGILIHTSKSDDKLKTLLKDVNKLWAKYWVIIYSPTIEAGVDATIPFTKMYVMLSGMSCSQRALDQMIGRIRNLKCNKIQVFMNKIKYSRSCDKYYGFEETESILKNMIDMTKVELDTDEKGKMKIKYNLPYFNICVHNEMETLNKSSSVFIPIWIQRQEKKGHTVLAPPDDEAEIIKQANKIKNEKKKEKDPEELEENKTVNITHTNILKARDLFSEKEINELQKFEELLYKSSDDLGNNKSEKIINEQLEVFKAMDKFVKTKIIKIQLKPIIESLEKISKKMDSKKIKSLIKNYDEIHNYVFGKLYYETENETIMNYPSYEEVLKKQSKNNSTSDEKYSLEKFYYKRVFNIVDLTENILKEIYKKDYIAHNYNDLLRGEIKTKAEKIQSLAEYFQHEDINIISKKKKFEVINDIVNDITKRLGFKNINEKKITKDGEITLFDTEINDTTFEDFKSRCLRESKLFTDVNIWRTFDLRKDMGKHETNKSFMGTLNSVLKNYGVQFRVEKYGAGKKKSKYFLVDNIKKIQSL